ncbi:MAG: putative hydro-lyase [Sporolactobacillus sp.]
MAEHLVQAVGKSPAAARAIIRAGGWTKQTCGIANGYMQANLVILPKKYAYDFLLFCQRNPRPCPLLEVLDAGDPWVHELAPGADIRCDVPKYRIYREGELSEEAENIGALWQDDFVTFLIGCSFSFEESLLEDGLPVRHIEQATNVPMYRTSLPCRSAGVFSGPLVVSMRPMTPAQAIRAVQLTSRFSAVHGAPVHLGDPAAIGIADLDHPDFGDPVSILPGEIPVFWACGVTPQAVVMASRPSVAITHAPGCMFITDHKNTSWSV